jgi:DNA-binding PadR family transcriptional regulator
MEIRRQLFIGILSIFVVPAIYIGENILAILLGSSSLLLILMLAVVMGVYLYWLFDVNTYGPGQIREVRIPDPDRETAKLLKMTDRRGDLINVRLLQVFENSESHTRSDIREILASRGIRRSQPTIDDYVNKLGEIGLLSSSSIEKYDKLYSLTKDGQHHLWLAKTYFPKSRFFFIWRHYLGIKGKVKKNLIIRVE